MFLLVFFAEQHWNSRHMTSTSSFEARLAEADAYLKLLIDQAKVCTNDSASSRFIFTVCV